MNDEKPAEEPEVAEEPPKEEIPTPEPPVEEIVTPVEEPEVAPETPPVDEPITPPPEPSKPEPASEPPVTEKPPESEPEPAPLPPVEEELKAQKPAEQPIKPPAVSPPQPPPDTKKPFDVNTLSDAELKAASALYIKRNQAQISRKGVLKRQKTMELNLREIVDFLSHNNGSPLPRIAHRTNVTPGTTSKYLRQLIASGKVRGEGWGKTRRYYLK